MDKIRRYSSVAFTALFALAVFFFFWSHYNYHLLFLSQSPSCLQHSEWTAGCFASACSVPGGFSDWCGRLLFHAFSAVPAIAAICALLLTMVQILCYLTFRSRNLLLYSLSFIPALLLWISFSNACIPFGTIVACIIAQAALYAAFRSKPASVIRLLLIPLIYMLCGPLALIYALAICADGLRPAELVCSILILAACISVNCIVFHISMGAGHPACPCIAGWMPFIVSFLAAAFCWVASLDWSGVRPTTTTWLGWCVAMIMAAAVPFCVGNRLDTCRNSGDAACSAIFMERENV